MNKSSQHERSDGEELHPPEIPHYEFLRPIGKGAFGEVWIAKTATGLLRAVKVIYRRNFRNDADFEHEFEALRRYQPFSGNHEGLIKIYHVGVDRPGGLYYYEMELADDAAGRHVAPENYRPKTLQTGVVLPPDECARIGSTLASALDHLHQAGLVHRDVKLSNVVFVDGKPKLADIGLASEIGKGGRTSGTRGYVAPEGGGKPSADIYALGKVLYEISTGEDREAFPRFDVSVATGPQAKAWRQLNAVLLKACEREPAKRYRSAVALVRALAGCLLESKRKPLFRRGVVAILVSALLLIGLLELLRNVGAGWLQRSKVRGGQVSQQGTPPVQDVNAVSMPPADQLPVAPPSTVPPRTRTLDTAAFYPTLSGRPPPIRPITKEGAKNAEGVIPMLEQQYGSNSVEVAEAWGDLAFGHYWCGNTNRVGYCLRRQLAIARELDLPAKHPLLIKALMDLGSYEGGRHRTDEAEALLQEAADTASAALGDQDPWTISAYLQLTRVWLEQGRLDRVESFCRWLLLPFGLQLEELATMELRHLPRDHRVPEAMAVLAAVRDRQGQSGTARVLLRRCIESGRIVYGPDSMFVAGCMIDLAMSYEADSLQEEALEAYNQARAIVVPQFGTNYPFLSRMGSRIQSLTRSSKEQAASTPE